jgi:spermidine synthase
MPVLLLFSAFVISTCGLVYELISGTLASYLLGDSITQFSTVIGVYLFSMGIGSFLSKYINRNLTATFIKVELLIGLVGGFSSALLFLLFEHVSSFRILLYALVSLTGILVGLEIPLLMRILQGKLAFKDLVAKVFTFDYIGALLASLLFPLVLVPHLGLVRSSFMFGIFNVLVAIGTLRVFRREVHWVRIMEGAAYGTLLLLGLGFVFSDRIMSFAEASTFPDPVIYAKSSPYQRIVLTRAPHDLRLFLNGNLQFSSRDEYRYHEALVHPGLASRQSRRKVLILGGGDGLAVREVLRYPEVESITLVDLDPEMTRLFSSQDFLVRLNNDAFHSSKVHVVNADAFVWLKENQEKFDFVIVDFPDPSNFSIGKLFSTAFYRVLSRSLSEDGAMVIQSTSPFVARKTFWCVDTTLRSVGLLTTPYHVYVPSFGEWGFVLATRKPFALGREYPPGLRYVNTNTAREMLEFPQDMAPIQVEPNRLNNQVLVRYFEEEWSEYLH